MIITRTPFRVSFVGGGSDMRGFYSRHGHGAVISAAIQQYMYIVIHPYFQDKIRIKYSKTEDVESVDEIEHPIVRECLRRVGVEKGVEIASFADVASGTGLGSSSAFTVGLLHALYVYKGKAVSKQKLAEEACEIEIDILGEPIGKQDQYASAYGGLNHIYFASDESVEVRAIDVDKKVIENMEKTLSLYYLGGQRSASEILKDQRDDISKKNTFDSLLCLINLVDKFESALLDDRLDSLGGILHEAWSCKKKISNSISNNKIDAFYDLSLKFGASGGKLLGAGGTGFLLLQHQNHKYCSSSLGCKTIPFRVDNEGSCLLFSDE